MARLGDWLHYEVDRTFNHRTTETSAPWNDDVTNRWFTGPYLGMPNARWGANTSIYYYSAPDRYGTALGTQVLPLGEWDYDDFTFFPGYGEEYYVQAYSSSGRDLKMEIVNRDRTQVAYNDDCDGSTLDPCITATFYDANSHYIRVWDDQGGAGNYYLRFRHNNDDHNDYEPEATPIPLSSGSYMRGYIHADDVDYFRVFVPNNGAYSTPYLPVSFCSEGSVRVKATLYNSARDDSGRFRNNNQLLSYTDTLPCPSYATYYYYIPGENVLPGWYFIKIEAATPGQNTYFRLKVGNTPTETISSDLFPVQVSQYWDVMYNTSTKNRIFRSAGFFKDNDDEDWYELHLDDMDGRLVSVDVYGLDDGSGGTRLTPQVELHSGTDPAHDNGYYIQPDDEEDPPIIAQSKTILTDKNGGLDDHDAPDKKSHLTFRVIRDGWFRIKVLPYTGSSLNKPYQIFIDVKPAGASDPALPVWD